MLPVDYNDREKKQTYIFFDFECAQDVMIQCHLGYQPDDNGKVIGGTCWVSQWRRLLVEIKACWSFEISSTIMTMYPIIFSLIVNFPTIMAYVVASVFFFGVITFITVNHYDVITSMTAFLSRIYFCTNCYKGYNTKEEHACNNVCHNCRKIHDQTEDDWIHW
jgi:hypothetical protein